MTQALTCGPEEVKTLLQNALGLYSQSILSHHYELLAQIKIKDV